MKEAYEFLRQLARQRFYGAVTIKFEAGRIVVVKKEQTLKPNDLSGELRVDKDEDTEISL